SAKLVGEVDDKVYRAASLIELLHTATLVHDDVVDEADQRRGFFSINALWKNKVAVLVGDYLLSKGLLLALDNEDYQVLQIVSKAVKAMSEGELLQLEKSRKLNLDEEVYYEIIKGKTASLLSSACSAGAWAASENTEMRDKLACFGEKIGIAFQIKDDLFDYGFDNIGKPTGIDIKEKKLTLPIIYTLNKVDKQKKRKLVQIIKKHNSDKNKVNELIEIVKEEGGLEYAEKAMYKYQNEALEILNSFENSEAKECLLELVNYVTHRKY
ncbi:MAG TPA: polyprenyl synthetase family protein, partial [Chitinophagaceae bacterium]|nr:polyprenyl synthetase family protein [Chitinophagaceae bacterium]